MNTKSRITGKIIYTNHNSRHGFILDDDSLSTLYFDHSAINANYHQFGDHVDFEINNREGRYCAENIMKVI